MTTVSPSKHQRIVDDLRQRITLGKLRSGDALPTNSQLTEQYGVALVTVRQALVQLQNEGLIWARRGKGTFVADRAQQRTEPASRNTVGLMLLLRQTYPSMTEDIAPFQAAVQAQGFDTKLRIVHPGDEEQATQWIQSAAGLVIWGYAHAQMLDRLAQLGRPIVYVGMNVEGQMPPTIGHVQWDIEGAVQKLAEHVFNLGHRRVRLVTPPLASAYFHLVKRAFFDAARRAEISQHCDHVTATTPDELQRMAETLVAQPDPPTALIVEHDVRACQVIHYVQNLGWPVPQRLSVATIAGGEVRNLAVPHLTHVCTPMGEALARAGRALLTMIDTRCVVHVEVPSRLHPGRTCQAPVT